MGQLVMDLQSWWYVILVNLNFYMLDQGKILCGLYEYKLILESHVILYMF